MLASPELSIAISCVALAVLIRTLIRVQSALTGLTLLVLFSISAASLAGFLWGRLWGLSEYWISPARYYVFGYSSLGVLGFVVGIAVAWHPLRGLGRVLRTGSSRTRFTYLGWANPSMIVFLLGVGVFGSLVSPLVRSIPTFGTAIAQLPGMLKLAVLVAIIYWRRSGNAGFLLLTLGAFIPLSIVYAMSTGFTPLSMDLALPALFVIASFSRFNVRSVLALVAGGLILSQLMFAWMNARWVIRNPEDIGNVSTAERRQIFFQVLTDKLLDFKPKPEVMQVLIVERLDHGQFLAMQADYQPDTEPYQYGRTIVDGLFALVPRFLWPDKPRVAGGFEFVAQYTGLEHGDDDTAIGVPIQFELYANGGPTFVIVGLTLVGWLMAWTERQIVTMPLRLPMLFLFLSLLLVSGNGISQVSVVLTSFAILGGMLYGIGRMIEMTFPKLAQDLIGLRVSPQMPVTPLPEQSKPTGLVVR